MSHIPWGPNPQHVEGYLANDARFGLRVLLPATLSGASVRWDELTTRAKDAQVQWRDLWEFPGAGGESPDPRALPASGTIDAVTSRTLRTLLHREVGTQPWSVVRWPGYGHPVPGQTRHEHELDLIQTIENLPTVLAPDQPLPVFAWTNDPRVTIGGPSTQTRSASPAHRHSFTPSAAHPNSKHTESEPTRRYPCPATNNRQNRHPAKPIAVSPRRLTWERRPLHGRDCLNNGVWGPA